MTTNDEPTNVETVTIGPDGIPDPGNVDEALPIDGPLDIHNAMVRECVDVLLARTDVSVTQAEHYGVIVAEAMRDALLAQLAETMQKETEALGDLTLMDLTEFRDRGYLFEVNRRFFHPLGMALVVNVDTPEGGDARPGHDAKVTHIMGIDDARDDPDGYYFGEPTDPEIRAKFVEWATDISNELHARSFTRTVAVGGLIQPPDVFPPIDEIATKAEPG